MFRHFLCVAGVSLALAGPGLAQTQAPGAAQDQQQLEGATQIEQSIPQGKPSTVEGILPVERESQIRAGKLIGMPVVNTLDQDIGTVEDIVFDQDGRVEGIVLSTGGFLGFGAKPVGIAWSDIRSAMDSDALVLELSKEQLAQAPEFKTKEQKRLEEETEMLRQQQEQQQRDAQPTAPQPQQ